MGQILFWARGFMDSSYLGAVVAILAFGSYMVPTRRFPDFPAFASLAAIGVGALLLSVFVALGSGVFALSPVGVVSGLTWVVGGALCFYAVQREADLAGTNVRSCGTCVLTSFLCGLAIFHDSVNFPVALPAIALLIAGLMILAPQKVSPWRQWRSICGGVVYGVHLLPFQFSGLSVLEFAPSYALGICLGSLALFLLFGRRQGNFKVKAPWVTGVFAGALWMVGTHGSFWAIDPAGSLGYAVGYPLTQLNLLVNVGWGVLLFGEYKGRSAKCRILGSAAVILLGAVLLAVSKT